MVLKSQWETYSVPDNPPEVMVSCTVLLNGPDAISLKVADNQGFGPTGCAPPLYSKSRLNVKVSAEETPAELSTKTPHKKKTKSLFIVPPPDLEEDAVTLYQPSRFSAGNDLFLSCVGGTICNRDERVK
jgi:hypothetical protein